MSTRIAPLVAKTLMITTPDNGSALEFDWGIWKCHGA